MIFTAVAGCRYRATISLGFFKRMASNDTIKSKLEEVGLKDVVVNGSGGTRLAEATASVTATVDLPSEITNVVKIG